MAAYSAYTDQELVALLKQSDQLAYTEIFNRYTKPLVAHAYRLLGQQDEANDVVQDVLMMLWQKRDTLVFTTSLTAFLYTAIRNKIFNHMAHQKVVSRYADSIVEFMESDYSASDMLVEKELNELIEKEIAALPPKMREVFLLSKREELSYKEIGIQLNITDKTAKQQVYNAVKLLRLKMDSFLSLFPFL